MKDNIVDINYAKIEAYINMKRPSEEIRDRLDFGFKFDKGAYELFEILPIWGEDGPIGSQNSMFAKIKYVKSKKVWKLYWMRASGRWEAYDPFPESSNLDKIIECIEQDAHGCFYG